MTGPRGVAIALAFVAGLLGGVAGGRAVHPATTVATPRLAINACSTCPGGLRVTAVTVEARQGSVLFIFDGSWPAAPSGIGGDLSLTANDVHIVLRPSARPSGFAVVSAQRGAVALPAADFAAGLRPGSLLLDVQSAVLGAPLAFSLDVMTGAARAGGVPDDGMLHWSGSGAPAAPTPAPAPGTPAPAGADPAAIADGCPVLPYGAMPAGLILSHPAAGTGPDPRTHSVSPYVSVEWGTGFGSTYRAAPPFAVIAVIGTPGSGTAVGPHPIDGAGTLQFIFSWDGRAPHKSMRRWDDTRWTVSSDTAASGLTLAIQTNGIVFYSVDLAGGDTAGFVSASAGACATAALTTELRPLLAIG